MQKQLKQRYHFVASDTYNASIIKDSIQEIKGLAEQNGYSFIEIDQF